MSKTAAIVALTVFAMWHMPNRVTNSCSEDGTVQSATVPGGTLVVVGLVRRMERADVVRAPVEMPPGRNSIVLSGFLDDLYGVDGKNLYIRTRRLCDGGGSLTCQRMQLT